MKYIQQGVKHQTINH